MDSTKIQPNDIVLILRPDVIDNEEWVGTFEVVISGYGPFTISMDDVQGLVTMAMMMASTVSLMEESEEFAQKVMIRCAEIYGQSNEKVLSMSTKCVGGVQ